MPRDVRTIVWSANAAACLAIAMPLVLITADTGWAQETKPVLGAVPSIHAPTAEGASVAATAGIAKSEAATKAAASTPAALAAGGAPVASTAAAATAPATPAASETKTESTAAATPPDTPAPAETKTESTAAATPAAETAPAETKTESTAAATPPDTPAPAETKSESTADVTPPAAPAPTDEKTETTAAATPAAASSTTPATTGTIEPPTAAATAAATPDASAPATPAVTAPPPPPADPIVAAVRGKLTEPAVTGRAAKDDVAAMVAFYGERSGPPLWVEKTGFTAKAKSAMDEVRKADDWGLQASAFNLPTLPPGEPATEALAEAEARLSLELLKYARFAKGGRVNPRSLSRILDQDPPIRDPKVVLGEYAATDGPSAYMRGLHPRHEQFERLRQALLKARGGATEPEEPIDEALRVKLPAGKNLKPGVDAPEVALLRQRLKVPAGAGSKDTLFDQELADALKAYQQSKGITPSGALSGATRTALNQEGEPKKRDTSDSRTQRILINMERWRWMPENLGSIYIWNNIPEFYTRVVKGKQILFKEKIIVGLPEWATPVFSAEMQFVGFNPSWGVPDGIKMRELLPRLRASSGGFFFFGGGGGDVLRAYGLTAYRGGRPVDPDSVNWSSVDIRQFSFVQPPGGKNPLGMVKFRFPNKHDVYMHDTIERPLFGQSNRALSHGCIRVQNPRKLAEILIAEGNSWDEAKVENAIRGGGEVTLQHKIPVHMTYFTAMVQDDGSIATYGDLYGHDSRLSAALGGRALPYESSAPVETAANDDWEDYGGGPSPSPAATRKGAKKKQSYSGPATLSDAISGLLTN